MLGGVFEAALHRTGTGDPDEDGAPGAVGIGTVAREVGAAQKAHDGHAVDHQAQGHGVLVEAEEALGAVDGVEDPEGALSPARVGAAVDGGEDLGLADLGEHAAHGLDHLGAHVVVLAQGSCIFLADQGDLREGLGQQVADDGLRGEVGDGDGTLVALLQAAAGDEGGLDGTTDVAGGDDGLDGVGAVCGEVHDHS